MGEIFNHDEAFELAQIQQMKSNLARCYLSLRAENQRLRDGHQPCSDPKCDMPFCAMASENKRLRHALKEINICSDEQGIREFARKALERGEVSGE